jgi:hypothetical protein
MLANVPRAQRRAPEATGRCSAVLAIKQRTPLLRIPSPMHARYHDHLLTSDPIVQPLRKSLQEYPSGVTMDDRVGFRKGEHRRDGHINRLQEILSESRSLLLVPQIGAVYVK